MNNYDLVIPVLLKDAEKVFLNLDLFLENLECKSVVFIGNENVKKFVDERNNPKLKFVNESELLKGLSYDTIHQLISNRIGDHKRAGWYLQQFIKMSYSYICTDDYYMGWDSDTVPVRKIKMFDGTRPYFDMKTEYHKPYFETIYKLLGLKRVVNKSYISEHMVFNRSLMQELIKEIEQNKSIPGEKFYEKIINSIDIKYLKKSGYAEFETYGVFVSNKYPDKYIFRDWYSLRRGAFYFTTPLLDKRIIDWIAKDYHAISFEKSHIQTTKNIFSPKLMKLFRLKYLVKICDPIIIIKNFSVNFWRKL